MSKPWFVYIVECCDSTYYVGITTEVARRIKQHSSGKGAKYTRSRKPVKLLHFFEVPSRSEALKQEAAIKKLKRDQKINYFKNKIKQRIVESCK